MTDVGEWEAAWAEYVQALEHFAADWSGPDFVHDIGLAVGRVEEAARRLRLLEPYFCRLLNI